LMLAAGYGIAPFFIRVIAPGFEGERLQLALKMNTIMLPSLVFLGLMGLYTGIFQAYRLFTLPALAGLLYNTCLIGFLVGAKHYPLISLGFGGLTGTMVQVLVLMVFARRVWPEWGMQFRFTHPMLQKVWKLMIPIFIGTGVGYVNLIIDRIFASLLPVGTIAALNFAMRVKEIPTGLFAVALSQATYPVTALQATRGETQGLRDLFSRSLETLWLFIIPSAAGLLILPQETVRFLFERGAFTGEATAITAQALFFYILGLPATASLGIIVNIFYSFQDTSTPVKVGIAGLLLNILLNAVLIHRMAHRGLALATSLSATFMFLALLEILRRRVHGIGGKILLPNLGKILLATLVMAVCLFFLRPFAQTLLGYLGVIATGVIIYGISIFFLKPRSSEKIIETFQRIWKRFRPQRGV
ncbi:MAG: murein biosynthesis integral membrane protein MurJ, partial [Candidatus Atribacteria bacterium]|nr:murein biosynthesis integral membrane protein MurJ [Candidatus Atribacteria bacterium]